MIHVGKVRLDTHVRLRLRLVLHILAMNLCRAVALSDSSIVVDSSLSCCADFAVHMGSDRISVESLHGHLVGYCSVQLRDISRCDCL